MDENRNAPLIVLSKDEILGLAATARRCAENGRLEEALSILNGLIAADPRNAYLHTCVGCVLMQLDRTAEAREAFDKALGLDPRDVAALTYAGELAFEAQELPLALERLGAAIALDPEGRNPYANRARTLHHEAAQKASTPARG